MKLLTRPARGATIDELRIVLNGAFSVESLRSCLELLPNITDFVLLLSEPDLPALLEGVYLPKVQFFRTNVHHHLLLAFLMSHSSISILHLAACGDGEPECPLKGQAFTHLRCITGPTECMPHLTHTHLSRLTMALSDGARSPSIALRSIPARIQSLYALTLDFYADDYDILTSIVAACATVQKLKLVEKPVSHSRSYVQLCAPNPKHQCHRNTSRRAWNDGLTWSKTLRRLPRLEELLLRTASPLIRGSRIGDSEAEERRTLMCWVLGNRSGRGRSRPHPTLLHIGVWYRASDPVRGVVSHWSKPTGTWERSTHLMRPPADYDFV
ncbi:hypothetical protein LXA43DRAFT_904204 [Ganoderma leucocontextum]|nr:hypothetical protein LXA43DRAFT_904204 [Ganoderma leucocontextum]